jgi:hypothetical protein
MGQLRRAQELTREIDWRRRNAVGLQQGSAITFCATGGPLGDFGVDQFGVLDAGRAIIKAHRPGRVPECDQQAFPLVILHGGDTHQPVSACEHSRRRQVSTAACAARAAVHDVRAFWECGGVDHCFLHGHVDVNR